MRDHVAVGVTGETPWVCEPDAAKHERDAVGKCVRVDAEADAEAAHPTATCVGRRRSKTVTVSYPAESSSARARSKSRPTSCGTCASDAVVMGTPRSWHARRSAASGYSSPTGF